MNTNSNLNAQVNQAATVDVTMEDVQDKVQG